jgi:hypothetical protein
MAAASLAQQPDADQGPPKGMGMMGAGYPMIGIMGRNCISTFLRSRRD